MSIYIKIAGLLCIVCLCIGIYGRTTHTDLTRDEANLEDFIVNLVMDNESMSNWSTGDYVQGLEEHLDTFDHIVRGRFTGKYKVLQNSMLYELNVKEVYRGSKELKGKTVDYVCEGGFSVPDRTYNAFVNRMKKDHEYLIFMNKAGNQTVKNVFHTTFEFAMYYFDAEDCENRLIRQWPCRLKDVNDNEFFAADRKVLEKMIVLKRRLFARYS